MSTAPTQDLVENQQENNTTKNLTGFQLHPENINKNGRPKGKTFSGYLRELLEEIDPETKKENFRLLSEVLFKVAKRGDVTAIREFADRIDGRPSQKTDITSNGETITGNTIVFKDFSNDPTSE